MKIKEYLHENWLFTIVLALVMFCVLSVIAIGTCMIITENVAYPAWKNAHVFYTSENKIHFIYYEDVEGEFMILNEDNETIFETDRAVEVFPGDTVIFRNENGTYTSVDLIHSTVSISRENESVSN